MTENLVFETQMRKFAEINLLKGTSPPHPAVDYCCPPFHPESHTGILTRPSALLLLQLHPLVLWGKENYCVLGRRTLHLAAPHLYGRDVIRVGFLPKATLEEVQLLMTLEPLLNQVAFATQKGSQGIFAASRRMDSGHVKAVAPLLAGPVDSLAKMFADCSVSTLFKLSAKLQDAKPT